MDKIHYSGGSGIFLFQLILFSDLFQCGCMVLLRSFHFECSLGFLLFACLMVTSEESLQRRFKFNLWTSPE